MPTTIIMPQLGESVAEGVIGKWLKQEGEHIDKDEPIVEVITDKVNAEIPSPVGGTLQKITQPEGATVAVGQEIAIIGEEGDGSADRQESSAGASNGQSSDVAPTMIAPGADSSPVQAEAGGAATATAAPETSRAERVRTSPLVKRLAEQYGINLAEVPGTGIGGRVSKQDIMSFIEQKQQGMEAPAEPQPAHFTPGDTFERPAAPAAQGQAPRPAPSPAPARQPGEREELVPVTPLRKMIADRMVLSVSSIPHAVTNHEVDMTNVVRFREGSKAEFQRREGVPLSYVAFVIKATVDALKEHPMVNSEWAGENIILKRDININIAVDAPDGLTTPVIHNADDRSLAGLSKAIYELAMRARDKKLRIEDMQGGTFTVNNTGALGSLDGASIINYPQCGILSAGTIVKRPMVLEQDGQDLIAVRSMMVLSFSFDHRILDGGSATAFVNAVKRTLESWPADYPIY